MVCERNAGLSVDIFCWGSGAPTIWISKGPKQNLKGPSIEIHYQFSNFGGSIGPPGKISQGPHWIFRGPGPLPPGPPSALEMAETLQITFGCILLNGKFYTLCPISLCFVPEGPIDNEWVKIDSCNGRWQFIIWTNDAQFLWHNMASQDHSDRVTKYLSQSSRAFGCINTLRQNSWHFPDSIFRCISLNHDDVIEWKHSALLTLCVRNSLVTGEFPHTGQWRRALMFSLIYAWINSWVNNREADNLRCHRAHYDVNEMMKMFEFRLKLHWNLFLRIRLTIFWLWFRQWLGIEQVTSHYLK